MIQKTKLKLLALRIEWQWLWIMRFRRKAKRGKNYAPSAEARIKKRERKACALKQAYENLCGLTETLAKAHMISLRL